MGVDATAASQCSRMLDLSHILTATNNNESQLVVQEMVEGMLQRKKIAPGGHMFTKMFTKILVEAFIQ